MLQYHVETVILKLPSENRKQNFREIVFLEKVINKRLKRTFHFALSIILPIIDPRRFLVT